MNKAAKSFVSEMTEDVENTSSQPARKKRITLNVSSIAAVSLLSRMHLKMQNLRKKRQMLRDGMKLQRTYPQLMQLQERTNNGMQHHRNQHEDSVGTKHQKSRYAMVG